MGFKIYKKTNIWGLIIFIFWVFIYCNLPMTHDDWTYFSVGDDILKGNRAYPNGRYMGTLLTILLNKNYLIRIIIMPLIVTIISLLFMKAVSNNKENKINILILSTILVITTPKIIFSQTFSWISGFSNYVPPIIGMLLYSYFIKDLFKNKREDIKSIYIIPLFILMYLNQLYIEHISVYFVIVSFIMMIYNLLKFKKIYKFDITVFIASVLGIITMFSNPAYHNILAGEDTYRSVETSISSIIEKAINQYINIINKSFFMDLLIIYTIIAIIIFILYSKKNKTNRLSDIIVFIVVFYPIYILLKLSYIKLVIIDIEFTMLLEGIYTIIYFISLILSIILFIDDIKTKSTITFYIFSMMLLVAPLTVVTPIGGRNFLAPYIFLILLVLELIYYLYERICFKLNTGVLGCILFSIMIIFGTLFYEIGKSERIRKIEIKNQISEGNEIIYVPKIKYEWYLSGPNPKFKGYPTDQFKDYYNIPYDKKLVLGSYKK